MECLDDNAASEFVSGSLAGTVVTKVEKHLAGCRDCRLLVAALAGTELDDSNADTRKHERLEGSQATWRPAKQLTVGDRVGRYLVLSTLGTGGMGVVFSAYDPQLDRKVALKLLRANLGATAKEARTRLKREAQAIAQLNHPNVVAVYDVGETDDGDVYIAMEFVEGDTLTTWLKKWPRTYREILEVFHQAARGLMAAHGVGLLHRDFKPDNVLVGGDGRVRVSDFGLARSVLEHDETARPRPEMHALSVALTATGTVLGTPRYMPPEQLTGPDIDARSDQFSFCVALYEALYGTHPLPGDTSVAMLETGARAALPPEGSRVPAQVGRAVMRGLDRDRAKRFPTMAALMAELTPPPERSPVRAIVMVTAALALVGAATAAVMVRRPEPVPIPSDHDEAIVKPLLDRINQLEKERKQLQEALLKRETDLKQVEQLKQELESKNEQIQQLVDQVTQLKRVTTQTAKVPAAPPLSNREISAAVATAQHDLEGCFDEWASRQTSDIMGKPKVAPKDAYLTVKLSINPEGVGYDPHTIGDDSSVLRDCVEAAITRVRYPTSKEVLDVSVEVAWAEPDLVNTSASVTGHHEAAKQSIDLQ